MPDVGTRLLKLEVEGTDFSSSVSKVEITAGEKGSDFVSFSEAAAGGAREYKLALTLKQSTDSASLWYYIWAHAGEEVDVVVRPSGGTTAGTATPQFIGTCIVSEPDGTLLGGSADKSASARMTTEVEWEFTAKPTLDITA